MGPVKLTGAYGEELTGYRLFRYEQPFTLKHGGVLPELELAYETWGELNNEKSNAILINTGLSASSHAKSHKVSFATISISLSFSCPFSHFLRITQVMDGGRNLLDLVVPLTLINSL